jgi:hypothetical protein
MQDPTPARLTEANSGDTPYMRLSSEMIPLGLALVADKHRGVLGTLTTDNLETFLISRDARIEGVVAQFSSKPAANASIIDFCIRNEDVILPLFTEDLKILCAPATTFAERNKAPERLLILGLMLNDKIKEGKGRLKYVRLPFDKAPPEATHVLLLK